MYLLRITEVDPLAYELSFERFLSDDRADLPDIDLDVCQVRRSEILQYITNKYGEDRVAHIGVLNTFGTRGAVRQAGKHLNLRNDHINLLAKLLPSYSGQGGIRHCLETLPELQNLPVGKEPYQSLFRIAGQLEGLPRNISTHPSGIIIGDEHLAHTVALQHKPGGGRITAFTKEDIRTLGLLKIDLLGLRNLTVIDCTLQSVRKATGKTLEVQHIPPDDPDTFRTIAEGNTLGCFQLESMGIRGLMRRTRPKSIEDITALLALYRPGAWEQGIVDTYVRRRRGEEKMELLLPEMETILSQSYGLILYQEQVMQIACAVAGYTMGEADSLRRLLAKERFDQLQDHREKFIRGAAERGRSEQEASAVFDFLIRFTGYSFNKAHSVSYAFISYWTVYLKTHYPKQFMCSLLSTQGGYYDKRVYLRETVKLGIPLLRPDVNRSGFGFTAEEEGIRVGMDTIRGSGPEAVTYLLRSRQQDGPFTSWQDFLPRMKAHRIKMPVLQAWVASGACDSLDNNRSRMIASLHRSQPAHAEDNPDDTIPDFSPSEKRTMEKMSLGFSLEQAPTPKWLQFLQRYRIVPIETLRDVQSRIRVRICGSIIHSRRQPMKSGDYVLVLVVQDHTEMVEVIVHPTTYKSYLYELNPQGIIVEGTVRSDDSLTQIIAEKIKALGG